MREIALSVAACLAVVAAPLVIPRAVEKVIYDDRPAMVVWDLKPTKTRLTPGESWGLEFNYTKRAECYPPAGSGEVEYRLWTWTPEEGYLRFVVIANSVSFAAPSAVPAHRVTTVPLPMLQPGRYGIETRATFTCHGASKLQHVNTVLIEFEVVAPATSKKVTLNGEGATAMPAWTTTMLGGQ